VAIGEGRNVITGIVSFAASAVLFGTFVTIERRVADPLLRLAVLREGLLLRSSLAGLLSAGAFFAFQFVITLYLQGFRGWSPIATGLTFAVMGADMILAPLFTHRLVKRFGNAPVITAGLLAGAVAFALALRLDGTWGYLDLLPSLMLIAVMFALIYGPLAAAATAGLDESEHGVGGGVVYTALQFGAALGVSVVTIVLVDGHAEAAGAADYQRALLVPAIGAALALALGISTWARARVAR